MVDIGGTNEILGAYESHALSLLNEMIPFLSGYHISFCYFFSLKVVRGPDFCVKLKMFPGWFHTFGQMDKKIERTVKWGHKDSWCL